MPRLVKKVLLETADGDDAGESTGIERLDRASEHANPQKGGKIMKKKGAREHRGPGPAPGARKSGKYPSAMYLFDTLYHANKNLTFEQATREMQKHFPDKRWHRRAFGFLKALHDRRGFTAKSWYNRAKGAKKNV